MIETFRQGLYIYVGGILFCIATAILMMLNSSLIDLGDMVNAHQEVVYDLNEDHHIDLGGK